ncbi:MAG TPA: DUF1080 domain-containing protein [Steroidobacteraceae bacterium]|nr:DUF1080 domain-containing protein [Steroidobacteraceae bacterium]
MTRPELCAAMLTLSLAAAAAFGAEPGASAAGWRALLEEHGAPAWRGWKAPGLPAGWHVDGGVLHKDGPVDDLVTYEKFGNFELELEWKIGKQGNSGIFYRGTREYDHIYWSAPEYQLLDDANTEDGKSPLTAAGSDYALYGVPPGVARPYDHWNRTRLIVRGNHVEHWLNGIKVVEYDFGSDDWKKRVAGSKFSRYPNYGLASTGLIGIQGDHPGALAVRNIRIRELK